MRPHNYMVRRPPVGEDTFEERISAVRLAAENAVITGGAWEVWMRIVVVSTEAVVRDLDGKSDGQV